MTKRRFIFLIPLMLACLCWNKTEAAEPEKAEAIGYYTAGCIKDAAALPVDGKGYQVIRLSRKRFYGHPELIEYIQSLGQMIASHLEGTLLIGDLSLQKGGPLPSDHSSHQIGLDADILFWQYPIAVRRTLTQAEREGIGPASLLSADNADIDISKWVPVHGETLRLAASSAKVERIFVNPLIKKKLCETYRGEEWLRKIRPWYGHDGHFHVRLGCPDGSPLCEPQETIPPGDGCGADLDWWFTEEAAKKRYEKSKPKALPKECLSVLAE